MLPAHIRILLFGCLMTTTGSLFSQNRIASDVRIPEHPRILLLEKDLQTIKNKVNADSSLQEIHAVIIKECNALLSKPTTKRELKGRRLLEVSQEAFRRIFFLSYGWRMTQDQKYLSRAELELLAVCSFTDWNPSHFLDVADMTSGVALGYDWLFTALSSSTRSIIRNAIIEKGLKPSLESENNSWLTASTNWNQVCNAGMTFGALAILESDKPLATQIINRAIESIPISMRAYNPDGNYPEGYGYWSYGTTKNVLLISALTQAFQSDFGLTTEKGFFKTPYYLLNMLGPTGQAFNYSDNDAKAILNPAMFWFAEKLKDPTLLYMEMKILRKNKNLHRIQELPAVILWGSQIDTKKITKPSQLTWVGQGSNPVAMMRSSWAQNATFIGLKGGSPYVNHGHMDIGSFVIDAMGERWAMDFDPQSYSNIESNGIDLWNKKQTSTRWHLFRLNNKGHSTLTINDQLQQVKGSAPITQHSDATDFMSAQVNLTSLYSTEIKNLVRGVAIINGTTILIEDEIEASAKNSTVNWKMLTRANVLIQNETTAVLTINGKKMIMQLHAPKGCSLKTWLAKPSSSFEDQNAGTLMIGFDLTVPAIAKTTVAVTLTPDGLPPINSVRPLNNWPKQ